MPHAPPTVPMISGQRDPNRSAKRPASNDSSMGNAENVAASTPTVNGCAPRSSAYSASSTRPARTPAMLNNVNASTNLIDKSLESFAALIRLRAALASFPASLFCCIHLGKRFARETETIDAGRNACITGDLQENLLDLVLGDAVGK